MNGPLNKTLERQVRRHFGDAKNLPAGFEKFLAEVNSTYESFEDDVSLLQNSIEVSSQELRMALLQNKEDSKKQKQTIAKVKKIIQTFSPGHSIKAPVEEEIEPDDETLFETLARLIEEHRNIKDDILRLSLAVEQNPASIVITDTKGNIEYVNPKFCNLTGYTKEEVIGHNPNILKTPKSSPDFYSNMWATILAGEEWRGEFLNRKKNGELYWESASISAVKNSKGEIINFLAIKEDITARKQAEETLENGRTLFRTIFDLIPDAVYVKDLEGRKTYANPQDVCFTGKNSEEEIIGKTDAEIYSPEQAAHSLEEDKFVMITQSPILNNEGSLLDAQGKTHILLTSKVPLHDRQGGLVGLVGITRDITEQKQFENQLQAAHKSLADILNAAIYTSIIASDPKGNISVFSKGAELMLGYTAEEMIGHTPEILHLENEIKQRAKELTDELGYPVDGFEIFVAKARIEAYEEHTWTYVRKNGAILQVNLVVTAIRDQGKNITGFLGIASDITEQKKNEASLLKARQEAENANRAKSEFLANVSHEIRTPMNAILGFSEILLEKISEPAYKSQLKTILNSGRTLLSLINDILDLSKIEAGKLEIEYEPMQYRDALNEIYQIFRQKLEKKDLLFELIVHPNVPEYIFMDEVRFNQILINLIGNAIKFTDKGFIRLESWVEKTKRAQTSTLVVEIEDTGIGVPQQQKEKIFEAFTQQSGQSNRQYEGTGLGLAITRKLIEKMNGTIELDSTVGKGSTFRIRLKGVREANTVSSGWKASEPDEAPVRFKPATIMIVDDVEYNRQVTKSMLESFNFTFIEANSGERALELLDQETPGIILMDVRMGGMSGIATTEAVKKIERLKDIPVLAFTASAMKGEIDDIKTLFDGYLRKPVSKKILIQTLKLYLPFDIIEQGAEEKMEEVLFDGITQNECKEKLPQMLKIVEEKLLPTWENISGSLVLFEIEEFCDLLEQTNQEFGCNLLETYTTDLRNVLKSFDVDLIEKTVKEFNKLYVKMKQTQN